MKQKIISCSNCRHLALLECLQIAEDNLFAEDILEKIQELIDAEK